MEKPSEFAEGAPARRWVWFPQDWEGGGLLSTDTVALGLIDMLQPWLWAAVESDY